LPFITGGSGSGGLQTGQQLDYAQVTSNTVVSVTNVLLVQGGSVTYDGNTRIKLEFYACGYSVSNTTLFIKLYESGFLTYLIQMANTSGFNFAGGTAATFLTPTAGAHSYAVFGFSDNTATVLAGTGSGDNAPSYLRITKA
jgi:NhaP-type Na+/H+ and K+/H+ antiporter